MRRIAFTSSSNRKLKRRQIVTFPASAVVKDNAGNLLSGVLLQASCEAVSSADPKASLDGVTCAISPARFVGDATLTVSATSTATVGTHVDFLRLNFTTESDGYSSLEMAGKEFNVSE